MSSPMIVLLGPTATGKTRIAALLAHAIGGEIISADSRQVYKGMDIGTGKDLDEYFVDDVQIRTHLIDIVEAGEKYSLFDYSTDFDRAVEDISGRGKITVVCGGSGMYIESALGLYDLKKVSENESLREYLSFKSNEELILLLQSLSKVHNTTDLIDRDRLLRAVEIALVNAGVKDASPDVLDSMLSKLTAGNSTGDLADPIVEDDSNTIIKPKAAYDNSPRTSFIYGLQVPREIVRSRITDRLRKRLKEGLIEEVEKLHKSGVSYETLVYYGLEYKFIAQYLEGKLTYEEMVSQLNTAIHQFAKRQMTWFRRMERRGVAIKWLPPDPVEVIATVKRDLRAAGIISL